VLQTVFVYNMVCTQTSIHCK